MYFIHIKNLLACVKSFKKLLKIAGKIKKRVMVVYKTVDEFKNHIYGGNIVSCFIKILSKNFIFL
jgi:hypothetical protein